MPVYRNCCSTKLSSKSISFCKRQQKTVSESLRSPAAAVGTVHFPSTPWLPFTCTQSDSEQVEIRRLQGSSPGSQQPAQLWGSLTFSALERMQRMKNGSALPSVSSNLLSEVWNETFRKVFLQVSAFWVVFDSRTASASRIRLFQVWWLYKIQARFSHVTHTSLYLVCAVSSCQENSKQGLHVL